MYAAWETMERRAFTHADVDREIGGEIGGQNWPV